MTYQRSLLIDESPLQVLPGLAKAIGLNEAILLQQIHYWARISEHERDGQAFVPMSAADLAAKFTFWSIPTIKRTVLSLREKGLLKTTKKSEASWDRENWYAVDYDGMNHLNLKLPAASDQIDTVHRITMTQSIGSKRSDRSDQIDTITVKGKRTTKSIPGEVETTSPIAACFKTYQEGIKRLYGADYPPSARANGQLKLLVARVGAEHASEVVAQYLASQNPWYAKVKHKLDFLLRDAEQLYMDLQVARQAGSGEAPYQVPTHARTALLADDGRVVRMLEEYPAGDMGAIAKRACRAYAKMIAELKPPPKYIAVRQGRERRQFSIEEMRNG